MKQYTCISLMLIFISTVARAQNPVTFYKATTNFHGKPDTILTMDFSKVDRPVTLESFRPLPHLPPVRQDTTGSCWSFSAVSFLESELLRLGKGPVKLSEMYIVYHEYLEKARRFVREKGKSALGEGSEENAALMRIQSYGIVRAEDYNGLLPGITKYNHEKMFQEIKDQLEFLQSKNRWDEDLALASVRLILNKYMGAPPSTIMVEGKEITPLQYAMDVLRLPLGDYVDFMSFLYEPFYTLGEYKVEDNWWHSKDYHNVPLNEWYAAIIGAVKKGYTVAIGGDVSELGRCGECDIAIIPAFDIDPGSIGQDAREFRFENKTSTDDHGMHLVGYQRYKGHDWFLIKDSGSGAAKGQFVGYFFFREDFVKLKMLTFMVHRDAVRDLLKKFESWN